MESGFFLLTIANVVVCAVDLALRICYFSIHCADLSSWCLNIRWDLAKSNCGVNYLPWLMVFLLFDSGYCYLCVVRGFERVKKTNMYSHSRVIKQCIPLMAVRPLKCIRRQQFATNIDSKPRICVVGAGPAGFYVTQHILKTLPTAQIDIIERLPVPFGLVRWFAYFSIYQTFRLVLHLPHPTRSPPHTSKLSNLLALQIHSTAHIFAQYKWKIYNSIQTQSKMQIKVWRGARSPRSEKCDKYIYEDCWESTCHVHRQFVAG